MGRKKTYEEDLEMKKVKSYKKRYDNKNTYLDNSDNVRKG